MCWLEGALKKKKGKSLKSCHSTKKKNEASVEKWWTAVSGKEV